MWSEVAWRHRFPRTPKTFRDFSCGGRIPRGLGVRQSSAAFGDGTGFDRRRPSRLLSPDPSGRGLPHSSVCSAPRCRPAWPTNSSAPGASRPWSPSPPASVISSSCSTASSKIPPPSLLTEHRCCATSAAVSANSDRTHATPRGWRRSRSRSAATTPPDTAGQRLDPGRGRSQPGRGLVLWHPLQGACLFVCHRGRRCRSTPG